MSEDLDGTQDLAGIGTLETASGASIINRSIPGAGVGDDLRQVSVGISGLPLIRQGDKLSLAGIKDEAGNAAESDAAVIFADKMEPLIVTGVISDGDDEDKIVLTFTEPLEKTSAETIGNYTMLTLPGRPRPPFRRDHGRPRCGAEQQRGHLDRTCGRRLWRLLQGVRW
jgi:hypothetical protein